MNHPNKQESLRPSRGVIFDVDGVLVDSYHAHFASWQRFVAERQWTFSEQQFAATFGRTSRDIIVETWGEQMGLSDEMVVEMDRRKGALYREIIAKSFPVMDGAPELIHRLAEAGFGLAVGSSGPTKNVRIVLQHVDPQGVIAVAVTGDDVTRGKPDPQVFQLAADRLGLPPSQCVVVEDAPAGIRAAHAAGMRCIAVASTGRSRGELQAAEIVVERLSELTPAAFAE
jgi:beta-phosphoglucomutase